MGPDDKVPSLHVFKTLPTFPIPNKNVLNHRERLEALQNAREEAANIKAEHRIKQAIEHNILLVARYKLETKEKVYTFSDARNQWISGLKVVGVERKNIWVNNGTLICKLYISQKMP